MERKDRSSVWIDRAFRSAVAATLALIASSGTVWASTGLGAVG